MSEKKENKKKKGNVLGTLFLILILIIAVLLLLIWKGGLGLGGGNGNGTGTGSPETAVETGAALTGITEETTLSESETETSADENIIRVSVSDSVISANGTELESSSALKDYILALDYKNKSFILCDNKALKASYDEAKAVLDELEIEYSEEIS